jgi:hypothetical protein
MRVTLLVKDADVVKLDVKEPAETELSKRQNVKGGKKTYWSTDFN